LPEPPAVPLPTAALPSFSVIAEPASAVPSTLGSLVMPSQAEAPASLARALRDRRARCGRVDDPGVPMGLPILGASKVTALPAAGMALPAEVFSAVTTR
jgi:hypothetical protein